jgi:bifunctional non-homologous end joining protein LigD
LSSASDGISDFEALRSRRHDEDVQLYAFDILALDGDDYAPCPFRCAICRDC